MDELGERIALLSAQISAATHELLEMLREFDAGGGWNSGFRSCAHWLVWRVGLDLGAAREKVRVARALGRLPRLAESMRRGEVSYSKVRALTRIATPATEGDLLTFARAGTAAHVERLVRGMRRVDHLTQGEQAQHHHAARYFQSYSDEDGMVVIKARLAPEAAAALLCAIDAGVEKLHGPRGLSAGRPAGPLPAGPSPDGAPVSSGRVTSVAASAQGAAVPGVQGWTGPDTRREEIPIEQRRADALVLVAESALAGGLDPGTRGDRYQVVVHVDTDALSAGSEGGGSHLADGTHVSAETCRRLTCDAALVAMRHAADGSVLTAGRRTRAISPGLRRALEHRDHRCRFPGCNAALCDAHHVKHWADGGETSLANTVLLCRLHHRAVHEEGFTMKLAPSGAARFYRPDGRPLPQAPPLPALLATAGGPVEIVASRLRSRGVTVDAKETLPDWWGESVDYSWAVEVLLHKEAAAWRARAALHSLSAP